MNHKVKWYKDDVEIRPSFVPSGGIPTTYEQELDETSGKLKLIITHPMNTDCGLYRCSILDRNLQKVDETSHLVYKFFNPPPHVALEDLNITEKKSRVVFETPLSDVTVDEGSRSIKINCKVSQYSSQSEIKWYKNNMELSVEGHREKYRFTKSYNRFYLEILNVTQSDAGSYECRVSTHNDEISSKCNVFVHEKVQRLRSKTSRGKVINRFHFSSLLISPRAPFSHLQNPATLTLQMTSKIPTKSCLKTIPEKTLPVVTVRQPFMTRIMHSNDPYSPHPLAIEQ